jgi:integrase
MGRKANWPPSVTRTRNQDRVWWNGRYYYLGSAGSAESRAEYTRLVAVWAADPNAVPGRAAGPLVAELCRDYLASDACPVGEPADRCRRAVELLLGHHARTDADEFRAPDLDAWQSWLCRQADETGRPLFNRTYIGHLIGVVRGIWKWGVRTGRVPVERYQELLTVPPPRYGACREPEPVAPADPRAVAAALPHLRPPVRAMVELEALTGARPGELCRLTPADVLRGGRVQVPGVGLVDLDREGVWVCVPKEHKKKHRRKPRWLVLGPKAQAVLAPWLERDAGSYCFCPREALSDLRVEQRADRAARGGGSGGNRKPAAASQRLRPGGCYTPRTYRQAVARACKRAGVPHFSPYQIRHAWAGEVDAAFDLDHVQASLGHDDPDTARRYSKRSFRKAADVAKGMG